MKRILPYAAVALLSCGLLPLTAGQALAGPSHDPTPEKEKAAVVRTVDQALSRDLNIDKKEFLARGSTAKKLDDLWQKHSEENPDSILSVRMDGSKGIVTLKEGSGGFKAISDEATKAGFTVNTSADAKEKVDGYAKTLQHRVDSLPYELKQSVIGPVAPDYGKAVANVTVLGEKNVKQIGEFLGRDIPRNMVIVKESAPKALPVGNQESAAPGAAYLAVSASKDGQASGCSNGFPVTDSGKNSLMLTAGHCGIGGKEGTTVYQAGDKIGSFAAQAYGGYDRKGNGYDYALVKLDRKFTDSDISDPAVTGVISPVAGAPACKLGARSGVTCGLISATDITSVVPQEGKSPLYVRGFNVGTCAKPGDSGGAVIVGSYAAGVLSTGSASSGECSPDKKDKNNTMTATSVADIFKASRSDDFSNKYGKDLALVKN